MGGPDPGINSEQDDDLVRAFAGALGPNDHLDHACSGHPCRYQGHDVERGPQCSSVQDHDLGHLCCCHSIQSGDVEHAIHLGGCRRQSDNLERRCSGRYRISYHDVARPCSGSGMAENGTWNVAGDTTSRLPRDVEVLTHESTGNRERPRARHPGMRFYDGMVREQDDRSARCPALRPGTCSSPAGHRCRQPAAYRNVSAPITPASKSTTWNVYLPVVGTATRTTTWAVLTPVSTVRTTTWLVPDRTV